MDLFISISLMYGITFALKDSSLLNSPRSWLAGKSDFFGDMISCAYCTGFHSGWLSFILLRLSGVAYLPWEYGLVVYAFSGASVSYTIDVVLMRLESGVGD